MEYSKLVAVSGLSGLYELINTKNDGAIVRSLDDKTSRFISARIHNFSHLESIEVFTKQDNVNLIDVFHAMEKDDSKLPDEKDPAAIKKYFEKVFSEIDFDKVYSSDLKKMVRWFEVLKKNNIEIKLSEPEPVAESPAEPIEMETKEEKKSATKKEEPVKAEEKKPAKKKSPPKKK